MSARKQTPKYSLKMLFNGEEFNTKTSNLDEAILALKPEVLHTEVYLTAQKGEEVSERRLNLHQAKRLFVDDITRQVFVQNLLLN